MYAGRQAKPTRNVLLLELLLHLSMCVDSQNKSRTHTHGLAPHHIPKPASSSSVNLSSYYTVIVFTSPLLLRCGPTRINYAKHRRTSRHQNWVHPSFKEHLYNLTPTPPLHHPITNTRYAFIQQCFTGRNTISTAQDKIVHLCTT